MDFSNHSTTRAILLGLGLLLVPPLLNSAAARAPRFSTQQVTVSDKHHCTEIDDHQDIRGVGIFGFTGDCQERYGSGDYKVRVIECEPDVCELETREMHGVELRYGETVTYETLGIEKEDLKRGEVLEGKVEILFGVSTIATVDFEAKWKQPLFNGGGGGGGCCGPVVVGPM